MMRRALALVALALLVVPLVQAAASGGRTPISADGKVNDIAIAATADRFLAGIDDPRNGFVGARDAAVWQLWNLDGSLRASGPADRATCTTAQPDATETCDSNVLHVAINAAGTKIAVVSRATSNGNDILATFSDTGGRQMLVEIPPGEGDITDLAMDAPGNYVAIGMTVPNAPNPNSGKVRLYPFASASPQIDQVTSGAVTDVDLELGLLVATGGGHYRFKAPGTTEYVNSAISGSGLAVDASTHASRWSVAGYSSGFFALFSDGVGDEQPSLAEYQKKEAGETTGINAVAIRNDATAFAIGSSGGTLRLYSLDPTKFSPDPVVAQAASATGLGTIHDIVFSADGRYLAVRAGDTLRLYSTTDNGLVEMWSDTKAGSVPQIAIDGRGEHVVGATGNTVLVYDAIHKLTPSLPSGSQSPGQNKTYSVGYRNDGNRLEDVDLTADPPAGVDVKIEPPELRLAPGQSKSVQVTVSVPAGRAPGTLSVPLRHTLGDGADGTGTANLQVTVPTVRQVTIEADGADSLGANGGGPAVFSVLVSNVGNVKETVDLRAANVPDGWTGTFSDSTLDLDPLANETVSFTLQPPAGARDGTTATVEIWRNGGLAAPLDLTATVGASFSVDLKVPSGVILQEGVGKTVQVTVQNTGNAPDSATVTLGDLPAGWQGTFLNGLTDMTVEDMEPGESRTLDLNIRAPLGSEDSVPKQVALKAVSLGDPSRTKARSILFTVEEPSTDSDSGSSSGDGGGGNGIPGPSPALLLALVACVALMLRRRPPA
ncbi:MAG TPA: NEW3 domain-containing protein [Candidatus Thermoplasmatota archaeon]|nr:NEW3 domain-containing protein [Candidatus Thermoplasmatota archaeon]